MQADLRLAAMLAVSTSAVAADIPLDVARGQSILAEARAACGGQAWDRIAGWHERGRITIAGHPEGSYEEWSAITSLAMAMRTEPGGAAVSHIGTDGTTSWRRLPAGGVDVGSASGPSRLHLRDAYLSNFAYFLPTRFPAAVVAEDPRTVGTTVYDVVTVRPAGSEDFALWIDRASHRVARIVVGNQVAELRNYRTVSGVCAPTLAIQTDGNPAHTTTLDIDSVDTAPLSPAVFAVPRP
ncbi:hypothetical protein [Polymorphobacter megasporae]|uniref:hypothetical protein n=1 Tax=Glacieibacterium megasporae TaxID=2835787 RepID=UPI001C1E4B44|nr:hypothetical protein [Polymorphobacter megasporae]UAJ09306.1 hypothetical protein KTC28_13395 [Polymorphobacter megasporae]